MSVSKRRERPSRIVGSAFYILAVLAVAMIFNLWPEKIAGGTRAQGIWTWSPLLNPAFDNFLPALNLLWGLSILLHVVQLVHVQRINVMPWASLLLHVYSTVLAGVLSLRAPDLFTPFAASWAAKLLGLVCLAMAFSALRQLRHVLSLETVIFQWEDAEMDRV